MSDGNTEVKRPCLPSERVLSSGAVLFPGVFDQLGCPLVIFPAEYQKKLLSDVSKEEVAEFVFYCLRLHNSKSRPDCLVSVVADLREASLAVTRRIAEILLLLQLHKRTVHSLYAVQPKKRDVQKLLQKLLSPSKRSSTPLPPLQCVFLKEVFELCNYVDRSQLTANLGGYFIYSHESWISFIKDMDSFVQEFVTVVRKLPVCIGALQDFSKLSVPTEYDSLTVFCSTNQARLEHLRRDLGLDALLKRCECVLEKFRYPERDPCYQAMVGTELFTHTALEMLQNYDRIRAAVEKVELLWRRVFSSARLQLDVLQLQRDAHQIVCEMKCVTQKMQAYTPETLRNFHGAEKLRQEFNMSVSTQAMMLVCRSEDVLSAVSEMAFFRQNREGHQWISELERWTDELREAIEFHNRNLNTICTFHQCYHKIHTWYNVAVCENFLQDLLWRTCSNKNGHEGTLLSHKESDDFSVIKEFLRLHPPPEVDELKQLEHLADGIPDAHLEEAGKQLAQRSKRLRKLLTSPGSVTLCDLQLALQWQYECLRGKNEMDSTSALHTQKNKFAQSVQDSHDTPHSVNINGLTRQDSPNYLPLLKSGVKPPSLSSFDSGFDGAGSGHLETGGGKMCQDEASRLKSHLPAGEENLSSISEGLAEEESLMAPNIRIIPGTSGECVNLEITVKRSAMPPKNPWLSLPVDDLENCYTVIISPSQQRSTRSCNQITQTTDTSVCDFQDQSTEWTPIHNILSSTVTDIGHGAETSENIPSLLWDSYDLHDLMHDSDSMLLGRPESEWEIKEQQELQAVEEMLIRTAGILQEEESVLAQEKIVDVLLEADNPDKLWPSWNKDCQVMEMSSSDLAEAGVIGLDDDLASTNLVYDVFSQEGPGVIQSGNSTTEPGSGPLHFQPGNGGPDRSELLKEIENLKTLEDKVAEENLKISELHRSEFEEQMSLWRLTEDRKRFLEKLEREKKEVEEMEKDLNNEMKKSKLKGPSGSRKIVTCSIMGKASVLKGGEGLLMNCIRSTQDVQALSHVQPCSEEPASQQPDMAAGDHVHYTCSYPEATVNVKCSNEDADALSKDCLNMPLNSLGQRNIETEDTKSDVPLITDLSNDQGFISGELKNLSHHSNTREEKCTHLDPSETLDTPVQCNDDSLTSEKISTPAFDPGGPTPLPQLNKPRRTDLADDTSHDTSQTAISTSLAPKPKERKNPPPGISLLELQHHNTNNNNLHTVDLNVASENVPERPRRSESFTSAEDQHPEAWCELLSRTPSPLIETSEPCGAVENSEAEVHVSHSDSAVTRRVCRSPVQQQLQFHTREMSDFETPVVLDTGSGLVKAGFADQDLPTTIFPTAIGIPKYEEVMSGSVERGVYVGHDAQHMRGVLTLHYPMRNGVVSNWDQMEMIWRHVFEQLRVCSEDHPVLLTEGVMNTHENRQRSIQLMFESFNVPLAYMAMQPVLALYTTGRTTGVVFDSGDGVSHSVPVFEGYCLPRAVQRFNLAGADVTLYLKQLLMEQGVCMRTSAEMEIVREVKEKCCCVSLNYETELSRGGRASAPVCYTLPDGRVISLTTERFRAPEILFRPELIGQDYYGMHESIFKSVLQSDIDLRRDLVGNIVLSGGNTLLSGLPERLQCEVQRLAPAGLSPRVKVMSPSDRDFSVWQGGALLASMPSFCSAWISQDEYEEFGPQIVFRKCF